jgi:hypothetical protein
MGTHSQFIPGKNKLKLFYLRNVQHKMPHGTQDSDGCSYPLSDMDIFAMAIVKQNIFT